MGQQAQGLAPFDAALANPPFFDDPAAIRGPAPEREGAWIAALVTGIIVWGLIFWVIWFYRRRSESDIPVQTRYNLPISAYQVSGEYSMIMAAAQIIDAAEARARLKAESWIARELVKVERVKALASTGADGRQRFSLLRDGSDRHERMIHERAFDVAEFSMSTYLMARNRGLPLTAVPVFPRRLFSASQMFVHPLSNLWEPKDLVGKKIAVQNGSIGLVALNWKLKQEGVYGKVEMAFMDKTVAERFDGQKGGRQFYNDNFHLGDLKDVVAAFGNPTAAGSNLYAFALPSA